MSQNSRKRHFSEIKGPCWSFPPKVTFSELTSRELIHFHNNLKNWVTTNFRDFGNVFPSNCQFFPKIKMVRMGYRNISYNMELTKYDPKRELWTKTENLRRSKNKKSSFHPQFGPGSLGPGPNLGPGSNIGPGAHSKISPDAPNSNF